VLSPITKQRSAGAKKLAGKRAAWGRLSRARGRNEAPKRRGKSENALDGSEKARGAFQKTGKGIIYIIDDKRGYLRKVYA